MDHLNNLVYQLFLVIRTILGKKIEAKIYINHGDAAFELDSIMNDICVV